jgi:hypothetical protein
VSIGGHARQTPDKGIHVAVAWTFADATDRGTFTPASGIPMLAAQLTADDVGKFAWQLDTDEIYVLTGIGPETWVSIGGVDANAIHDNVAGEIAALTLATAASADHILIEDASDSNNKKRVEANSIAATGPPQNHAVTHENGGSDEIDVTNLSGLLADAQTPLVHASSHSDGGSDEITVENLAAGSTTTTDRLRPDGAGGLEFVASNDITDFSDGSDTTSGGTFLTKVSITLPAEDATFIIAATALISHSNTTGNTGVRLQNTTDATTLGRVWNSEMADAENVISAVLRREYVQTSGAGAKVIALQYAVASGTGTMTISDAYITARREIS